MKDNLDFKLESALGSQKDKNQKRGIIWLGVVEKAEHFALQHEVGIALQARIGFALQPKVITFQQEVLACQNGRTRKVWQNARQAKCCVKK